MTVTHVILDIDQTVYKCNALAVAYDSAMIDLVSKKLGIPKNLANEKFKEKKQSIYKAQGISSSSKALFELGISVDEWIEFSCLKVDPRKFLSKDVEAIRIINWLCSNFEIGVISNNNLTQLLRTYEAIGVLEQLSKVLTLSLSNSKRLKPDVSLYQEILDIWGTEPQHVLVLGDRDDIDLTPAKLLGMRTYLIKTLDHLYQLHKYI